MSFLLLEYLSYETSLFKTLYQIWYLHSFGHTFFHIFLFFWGVQKVHMTKTMTQFLETKSITLSYYDKWIQSQSHKDSYEVLCDKNYETFFENKAGALALLVISLWMSSFKTNIMKTVCMVHTIWFDNLHFFIVVTLLWLWLG